MPTSSVPTLISDRMRGYIADRNSLIPPDLVVGGMKAEK
jgi:hypothetical protein